MKGNVIQMNTLHLNSVRLNGIGEVQSVSLKGGSTEDPVFPPIEPEPTPTYTLSASVTNGMVSATRNGSAVNLPFTANEGDTIVLSVTPNDGYAFEGWNDGNTDNPRSITMTADVALSAQCVEVVQPPVGNYIQFEDKAVEAICVENWSSDGIGLTEEDAAKVTSLGAVFKGNTEITSFDEFKYFKNCTSLANSSFDGCSSLMSIKFPRSISVGEFAFRNCVSLSSVDWDNIADIKNGAFYSCSALPSEVSIPNMNGGIGQAAFYKCTSIIKFSASATSIGVTAFDSCKLEEATLLNATSFGVSAFNRNYELKVVRLRDVSTFIGDVFYACSKLERVIVENATPPSLSSNAFQAASSTFIIYVPDASLEAYKTATNWNQYADRIHPLSEIEGSLVFYDKLVGDGTAYINTEYYAKGLDSVRVSYDAPLKLNRFLFGCKSSTLNLGIVLYDEGTSYVLYGSLAAAQVQMTNSVGRDLTLAARMNNGVYHRYLIGNNENNLGSIDAYKSSVSSHPMLLFACNVNANSATADRLYNGAIRSFSITDIDGNTIMSFKPCTWNGEAGMWDEVNGKFYGNASTSGEFSVANDE